MCPVGRCGIGTSAKQNVSTSEQVWQRRKSVDHVNEFTLHVIINGALSGESLGAFDMTRHRANKVWILDLLVHVADEGASSHLAACNLIEWSLHLGASLRA